MDESEEAVWRAWLEQHAPKFLLFARQQTRSEAAAQDLVQEALIECLRRKEGPPAVALVFATIHRRAIDLARQQGRRERREAIATEDVQVAWFDTSIEEREQARLVQHALETLPDSYKEVIVLKLWANLTFAEIAEALGIPANTAASRYRYGLQQLRACMKEVFHERV